MLLGQNNAMPKALETGVVEEEKRFENSIYIFKTLLY
jgi:hypothetical protein